MSILQLNPPIPIKTPKGNASAHALIDYGPEHNLLWVSFQDDTGECWTWQNKDIRAQSNITYGRSDKISGNVHSSGQEPRPCVELCTQPSRISDAG